MTYDELKNSLDYLKQAEMKRLIEARYPQAQNAKIDSMRRQQRVIAEPVLKLGRGVSVRSKMDGKPWQERFIEKVVGQEGVERIVPYIDAYQAGLNPIDRPAGIFLLVGPTGVGKTRTVEALAEALHGNRSNMLRLDCGEFELEHQVARMTGSPPGYLGHKETEPAITQTKLNAIRSDRSNLSLVLFDEIEKAHRSLNNLLLSIMDKGRMQTGDNKSILFENTLIFMTANTGASEMDKALRGGFGFEKKAANSLDTISASAARKKFAPEFMNRLDEVLTYKPLDKKALRVILDLLIDEVQHLLLQRQKHLALKVSEPAKDFLLAKADCAQYGARELRRVVQRHLQQTLALEINKGALQEYSEVQVVRRGDKLDFKMCDIAL